MTRTKGGAAVLHCKLYFNLAPMNTLHDQCNRNCEQPTSFKYYSSVLNEQRTRPMIRHAMTRLGMTPVWRTIQSKEEKTKSTSVREHKWKAMDKCWEVRPRKRVNQGCLSCPDLSLSSRVPGHPTPIPACRWPATQVRSPRTLLGAG